MSKSFKLCPTDFSRGGRKIFSGGLRSPSAALVTGLGTSDVLYFYTRDTEYVFTTLSSRRVMRNLIVGFVEFLKTVEKASKIHAIENLNQSF